MADDDEQGTDEHTGGMIALIPRASDLSKLAIDGGDDPEQLHLTLAFLGDDVTDWDGERTTALLSAAQEIAADLSPVTGRVLGRVVLNPDGDGDREPCAVYLISDAPELSPLHEDAAQLSDVEQFEPFIPHITADYRDSVDALTYSGPVVFDRLRVALGGVVHDFELHDVEDDEPLDGDAEDTDDESMDVDEGMDDEGDELEDKAAGDASASAVTAAANTAAGGKAPPPSSAPPPKAKGKRKVASKAGEARYKLPIGTELGKSRGTDSANKAQADPKSKAAYDDFMKIDNLADMQKKAKSLSDDDLKRLTATMYSFKSSNARVVAARNALATALRARGMNERDFGSLAPKGKTTAKPKPKAPAGAKIPPLKDGRVVLDKSVTSAQIDAMIAAGWRGRPGDNVEALYPPGAKALTGYLDDPDIEVKRQFTGPQRDTEEKGAFDRFVRSAGGAMRFQKPIGSRIERREREQLSTPALGVGGSRRHRAEVQRENDEWLIAEREKDQNPEPPDSGDEATRAQRADELRERTAKIRAEFEAQGMREESIRNIIDEMRGDMFDRWEDEDRRETAEKSAEDMDDIEVKRTTSKPWEKGKIKKAGHTVSQESGEDGDKYPIKTIGDLAAAVKRAKGIKDPEQRAKVWKHLRAEAKRLKAPNMIPSDAPSGGGSSTAKGKGGKSNLAPPFQKKAAVDWALTDEDREILAALELKFESPDPRAKRLRNYWARGEGRKKWNTFRELRAHLAKYVSPRVLNGLTANIYHAAKGTWPGRKGGEKAADQTSMENKVMIDPGLVAQMRDATAPVDSTMSDDEALDAYDALADHVSTEQDYEQAMADEVEWDLDPSGEGLREVDEDDDEQDVEDLPGLFDDDADLGEPARRDLLTTYQDA